MYNESRPIREQEDDGMTLRETIRTLEAELDMTESRRVEETGRSVAHLRD
jgi:hypothetical protein